MKYKTFEELKEELGDKFEEYMYKANIELLTKIEKIISQCESVIRNPEHTIVSKNELMKMIL